MQGVLIVGPISTYAPNSSPMYTSSLSILRARIWSTCPDVPAKSNFQNQKYSGLEEFKNPTLETEDYVLISRANQNVSASAVSPSVLHDFSNTVLL